MAENSVKRRSAFGQKQSVVGQKKAGRNSLRPALRLLKDYFLRCKPAAASAYAGTSERPEFPDLVLTRSETCVDRDRDAGLRSRHVRSGARYRIRGAPVVYVCGNRFPWQEGRPLDKRAWRAAGIRNLPMRRQGIAVEASLRMILQADVNLGR